MFQITPLNFLNIFIITKYIYGLMIVVFDFYNNTVKINTIMITLPMRKPRIQNLSAFLKVPPVPAQGFRCLNLPLLGLQELVDAVPVDPIMEPGREFGM